MASDNTSIASGQLTGGRMPAMQIARLQFLTMDGIMMSGAPVKGVSPGHLAQIEAACAAGIRWIQLRMKEAEDELLLQTAYKAKEICGSYDAVLIINDRVDIARTVKAHGVHLGKQDMPVKEARRELGEEYIIGGTANTAEDILEHARQGADYIGLGPYRHTETKKKLSPILGPEGYRKIMDRLREERINLPVVAIGGIQQGDLPGLLSAGLHGIAFSGLLVKAADKRTTVNELLQTIQNSYYADNRR